MLRRGSKMRKGGCQRDWRTGAGRPGQEGPGEEWELGMRDISSGGKFGVWPWEWVAEMEWKRNHWK